MKSKVDTQVKSRCTLHRYIMAVSPVVPPSGSP